MCTRTTGRPEDLDQSSVRGWLHVLLLIVLGVVLYAPSFALDELDDEEGRRALPAREMVASGDYVVPTIFGAPYLAKPPLFFWSIALASTVTGGVNEAATRLPSVFATIATALAVYVVGRRSWSERAGLVSSLLYLCTLGVFEKGAFGELEAVFSLFTFLASAALCSAIARPDRSALPIVLAGAFLAAALLTKGPPAFVFFAATAVGFARAHREPSVLRSRQVWLPVSIGTGIAAIWVALVLARPEVGEVTERWRDELARGDGDGLTEYLVSRWEFLVGAGAALLPSSGIWVLSLRSEARRRGGDANARTAELVVLFGLLFFGLMPGTHARYVFPLVPWMCLAAGRLLSECFEGAPRFERRMGAGMRVVAALGILGVAAVGCVAAGGAISKVDDVGTEGSSIAVVLLLVSIALWRRSGHVAKGSLWATFAVFALLREFQLLEVVPDVAGRRGRHACARALESGLPYGAVMRDAATMAYNDLFYVRAPIAAAQDPLCLAPGAILVIRSDDLARLERSGLDGRRLSTARTYEGAELVVVEIGSRVDSEASSPEN